MHASKLFLSPARFYSCPLTILELGTSLLSMLRIVLPPLAANSRVSSQSNFELTLTGMTLFDFRAILSREIRVNGC